jgi:hypothetical protein
MRMPLRKLGLARTSSVLAAVLLLFAVTALAQEPPRVYNQENTGAGIYPAPVFPDFAQLPIIRQLPDPFLFSDGRRDTKWSAQEHHRQDYLAALAQYGQGPKPECTGTSADSVLGVPYTCKETASFAFNSGSTTSGTLTINVTVVGPNGSNTVTAPVLITLPTPSSACVKPAAGWPYVIGMTGGTGSWPESAFDASATLPTGVTVPAAGCAGQVSFGYFVFLTSPPYFSVGGALGAFASYTGGSLEVHNTDGFYKLYPTLCAGLTTGAAGSGACNAANGFPNGSNSAEYAAWSYAISRVIDGIEMVAAQADTPLPLDTTHSATTGCSFAGKMALMGGALDERVALVISQENGGGGAPSWRVSHEIETQGSVEDINDTDYDWWDSSLLQFSGDNVYKLPYDNFELMALVAPRALLETGDSLYYWLGDRSATFDALATEAIYSNYGIGDRFHYYIDTNHFHCVVPAYQQNATQPIINKFLFGADVSTKGISTSWQEADALSPGAQPTIDRHMWDGWWESADHNGWNGWWGALQPAFPAGDVWNEGGDVMLPLNPTPGAWDRPLIIKTGDTITSQYQLSMPGTHAAATVTVPTSYTELDVACRDGSSYTFTVPAPVPSNGVVPPNQGSQSASPNSQTFTIAANDTSQFPSAVASATNPGCDDGKPGTVTSSYFFALGLPSPGAGNPGLTGFSTTDGVQGAATTDPLNVTFNIGDSNSSRVDWSPTTAINRQNPYSCTPPGCPLTPTITWQAPTPITAGTPLDSAQLDATASALQISGLTAPGSTGLLTDVAVPGTWVYSPAAGTVLTPGYYTLSATFTPTNIYTASTTAGAAYQTYTATTASVPLIVLPPPPPHHHDGH